MPKKGLSFFAEEQTGGQAITNLLKWCNNQCQFLVPGKNFDLPGLPENSVKVYVLGPPTDPVLLKKMNPGKNDAVHSLDSVMQLASLDTSMNLVGDALDIISTDRESSKEAQDFPFNKKFSIPLEDETRQSLLNNLYNGTGQEWRRIDYEWLSEIGRVALHMDTLTNNSSLVLAFELVKSKKVVLFVGDAQIGNWKSWTDVEFEDSDMKADNLLSRTVLYKVGHHSSHNATYIEGLNLMNEDELVIMIPVNETVSTKMKFAMLQTGMLAGYNRKSQGRIIRSDTVFHKPKKKTTVQFPFAKTKEDFTPALKLTDDKAKESHLFIEYTVK